MEPRKRLYVTFKHFQIQTFTHQPKGQVLPVLTSYFACPPIPEPSLWMGVMSKESRSCQ